MKVAILAGGVGSRLSEETVLKPKPMVEIGGMPILWHIMRHYAHYGYNQFVIALGYKGEYIKKWFSEFAALSGNMTVDLGSGKIEVHDAETFDWKVELIQTGQNTNTGGRIRRLRHYLNDETFILTWGDQVYTVDIEQLVAFHKAHQRLATITAVHPPPRFGQLVLDGDHVAEFTEKPLDQSWINGGLFVLEPAAIDYVTHDDIDWSGAPLAQLAKDKQLMAYRHEGFWQPMDALRDKVHLEKLWESGQAPWKIWDDQARLEQPVAYAQI